MAWIILFVASTFVWLCWLNARDNRRRAAWLAERESDVDGGYSDNREDYSDDYCASDDYQDNSNSSSGRDE